VEVIIIIALLALTWLIWQLAKAKQFNKFKKLIELELKPKVIAHILNDLQESSCDAYPNNQAHQDATVYFWTQYKSRILQAALRREIIDEQWLKNTGNLKNCQHLFHVEQQYLL